MAPSPGLFWRGRLSRRSRPRRRPGALRRLGASAAAVGMLSLVTLGVVQILARFASSEQFRVRALAIGRASEGLRTRLHSRLEGFLGTSLFDIDVAQAARSLEKDPWVRRAVVKRWLPGTLQVTVEERRPAAIGVFRQTTVLVDTEGWPIEAAPRELARLDTARNAMPRGEEPQAALPLPRLSGITARDREEFARQAATALAALARVRREAPALLGGLTEVDLSIGNAVVLKRGAERPQLWLCREDAGRNLAHYRRIQPEIERRFGPVDAIDLRWRDQIALRPGKNRPPGGKSE